MFASLSQLPHLRHPQFEKPFYQTRHVLLLLLGYERYHHFVQCAKDEFHDLAHHLLALPKAHPLYQIDKSLSNVPSLYDLIEKIIE